MEPFMEELARDLLRDPSWATFQRHLMAAELRTRERAQELHVAMLDIFELQEENKQLRQRIADLEHRLNNHGTSADSGTGDIWAELECGGGTGEAGGDLSRPDW